MNRNEKTPDMTVLVVEDDELLNKSIRRLLEREGFTSEGFLSGDKVLERVFASSNDVLLLLDYSLPDLTAKEIVQKVRAHGLEIPFVIITGHGDELLAVEMMKLGALDYIVKSIQFHEVVPAKVRHACEEMAGKRKLARAEEAVKMAAAEWQKTFDSIADAVFILDSEQRIVRCNRATLLLLGKPVEEVIGMNCCKAIHGVNIPIAGCPVELMKRSLAREFGEMTMGDRCYSITADPIVDSGNVLTGAVHVISDMTERKQAEELLRQSEEKFRILFDQASDIILQLEIKPEGMPVIREANSATFRLLGYERGELIGKPVSFIDGAPDVSKVVSERRQNILSGIGTVFEARHRCKDGTIRDFECSGTEMQIGSKTFAISVERDISERKQAEEKQTKLEDQLRQSQKLEAIGQLAGGVAHDFNNLLGAIMGNAELIKMHSGKDTTIDRYSDTIINSSVKAADLTRQLLTFARKARANFTKVNVHTGIENVIGLLKHTIDRRIRIERSFNAEPATVAGDSNMIENALLNLAINARDAMPDGGTITFTTSNVLLTPVNMPIGSTDLCPGGYVRVAVTDTGTGMDKETQLRIFEPFFTTKDPGKGTGLGLAAVYGCVRQHKGSITVDSAKGEGTTFTILLPGSSGHSLTAAPVDSACIRGQGNIMVVDDEQVVGVALAEFLRDLGYSPEVLCDPLEALEYFRENHRSIKAVVLDLIMPKMSGLDLFRAFKKLDPGVKVIVASGYSDEEQEKQIVKEGALEFVQKPYRAAEMSKALARVIGGGTEVTK